MWYFESQVNIDDLDLPNPDTIRPCGGKCRIKLSKARLFTAARTTTAIFLAALPVFLGVSFLDNYYAILIPIIISVLIPNAHRLGASMNQVKFAISSCLIGFMFSEPLNVGSWKMPDSLWLGVGWIGFLGLIFPSALSMFDPALTNMNALKLSLLFVLLCVPFRPTTLTSKFNPAIQMMIVYLFVLAICLVFAAMAPLVAKQIHRDFASMTRLCSTLFESMASQLKLTKRDSLEDEPSILNITENSDLLESEFIRREEELRIQQIEKKVKNRLNVIKLILDESQMEKWSNLMVVQNNLAIYKDIDVIFRDLISMRKALQTGFIPRLSLTIIKPLVPHLSNLSDSILSYFFILQRSLQNVWIPKSDEEKRYEEDAVKVAVISPNQMISSDTSNDNTNQTPSSSNSKLTPPSSTIISPSSSLPSSPTSSPIPKRHHNHSPHFNTIDSSSSNTSELGNRITSMARIVSKEYVQVVSELFHTGTILFSPTSEITRLNFFLWRMSELRKKLKSLERSVNDQRNEVANLGLSWDILTHLKSLSIPFISTFYGSLSLLYLIIVLFARFSLWILHRCCCKNWTFERLEKLAAEQRQRHFYGASFFLPEVNPAVPSNSSSNNLNSSNHHSSQKSGNSLKSSQNDILSDLELANSSSSSISSESDTSINENIAGTHTESTPKQKKKHHNRKTKDRHIYTDMNEVTVVEPEESSQVTVEMPIISPASTERKEKGKFIGESDDQLPPTSSASHSASPSQNQTIQESKYTWQFIKNWFKTGGWKFPLKVFLGLSISSSIALALQLYALPNVRSSWASVTVMIVIVPSLGATLKRAIHRVLGTLLGAIFAQLTVVLSYHTHKYMCFAPYMIFLFIVTYYQHSQYKPKPYSWTVANFTFTIILLSSYPFTSPDDSSWVIAGYRMIEVIIGCILVIGLAFVFPEKASDKLFSSLSASSNQALHAFVELISLASSGIQETGKISNLINKVQTATHAHSTLLKLAKSEMFIDRKTRSLTISITQHIDSLCNVLIAMYSTVKAGFSENVRTWISPYMDITLRCVLFIQEDIILLYDFLKNKRPPFRPEPTRIADILTEMDQVYEQLRTNHRSLYELYPELFRFQAFLHTIREFIVTFNNMIVLATEMEERNQMIHLYGR